MFNNISCVCKSPKVVAFLILTLSQFPNIKMLEKRKKEILSFFLPLVVLSIYSRNSLAICDGSELSDLSSETRSPTAAAEQGAQCCHRVVLL